MDSAREVGIRSARMAPEAVAGVQEAREAVAGALGVPKTLAGRLEAREMGAGTVHGPREPGAGVWHEALDGLDREGCAFGQVTRERLDNVLAQLQRVEATANAIAIAIGVTLQLMTFVFAVIVFLLNHVR